MAKGGAYLDGLLLELGICGWFPLGIFCLHFVVGFSNVFLYLGNTMATWIPKDLNCDNYETRCAKLNRTTDLITIYYLLLNPAPTDFKGSKNFVCYRRNSIIANIGNKRK